MKVKALAGFMYGGTIHLAGGEAEIAEIDVESLRAAGYIELIEPPKKAAKKKAKRTTKETEG